MCGPAHPLAGEGALRRTRENEAEGVTNVRSEMQRGWTREKEKRGGIERETRQGLMRAGPVNESIRLGRVGFRCLIVPRSACP